MFADLSESFARIDRAHAHGQAAITYWENLLKDNPASSHLRKEGHLTCVASVSFAKPLGNSVPISLEIGEFFYQLRAALDGAVYKLACIFNPSGKPIKEKRLSFPVTESLGEFNKTVFMENPFPEELKSWVESIQAYNLTKLHDPIQKSVAHWVHQLHKFCNIDKHRRLHIAAVGPGEITGHILPPPGCEVTFTEGIECNFFEGKFEFFRFGVSEPPPGSKGTLHVECEFIPQLAMEEIPFVPPWEGLRSMEGVARYVVERLDMVGRGEKLQL